MENNENLHEKLINIELIKNDNNTPVRKYLPVIVLAATAYYSFFLSLGLAMGYLGSKMFSKYLLDQGRVDPLYIDCGKWHFHLHHWIWGAAILLVAWLVDKFYLPSFFVGIILGIIAHDIYDYNDWRQILVKKEESK
jgi:hypothetical protein